MVVAVDKCCLDVGLRKQHLGHHKSWDFWCFTLLVCFVYCTVLVLAVLTDGRWKLVTTYSNTIRCHHTAWCCRQTQDVLQPAECPPAALQHQSDSGQHVSSLPDIVQAVTAACLLKAVVLSLWRLCRGNTGSHTVLLQIFFVTQTASRHCNHLNKIRDAKYLSAYNVQCETARVYPAIK